ncbi:glycosyltransferase [Microbacterium allomyrinae]|jgi:glycosyltransferase involved in cell wall biosynthesis|uniref:D-inositol 3-phosphate glycosyltransferase n=1 Tax=Microbacterium allomyrinae TaxID=2830666 RepID=A0A9X1LYQ7_9MICO|nr:glycosyltransferase [Microbacterium allomyrinae]MCC2034058.1 glycosyltransferase family 4 protein [Microbacterium allomyrinae]
MRVKLAITQPYVPAYRFPLWDGVIATLQDDGIDARIFFGGDAEQLAIRARRGDGVEAPWAEQVAARTVQVTPRLPKLIYRSLPAEWSNAPLLTEMQGSNGNAWSALARRRPYVTFGHGKEYTSEPGRVSVALESMLNRRATHVLTYLPSGRDEVLRRTRLQDDEVTSFNNSTDTRALRQALSDATPEVVDAFRELHGIPASARVALFLGALNEHKRIDLLVDAAREVLSGDSPWWLVVVGDGPEMSRVQMLARETGRVTLLGQSAPTQYAPAARISEVIINPGRIGLVAVDALAMQLPVVTTDFDRHAPEAEYLAEGTTMFTASATPAALASMWTKAHLGTEIDPATAPNLEVSVSTISSVLRKVVLS